MPDASSLPKFDAAEMKKKIRDLGPGKTLNPESLGGAMTAYAPYHGAEPYPGVKLTRDLKYGTDERNRLDVFEPEKSAGKRPALIFVHGGGFTGGDKKNPNFVYYDNVGIWAAKHGMVGVNVTYRLAPKHVWPAVIEDLANVIRWVQANGAAHGIDTSRIFMMGQSAGGAHVAQYIAHKEFHPAGGHGLKGAMLISGIYDLVIADQIPPILAYFGSDLSKRPEQSALPGLLDAKLPLLITIAENEPDDFARQAMALVQALLKHDQRFPRFQRLHGHNHISAMLHLGLEPGDQLGEQILDFIALDCAVA